MKLCTHIFACQNSFRKIFAKTHWIAEIRWTLSFVTSSWKTSDATISKNNTIELFSELNLHIGANVNPRRSSDAWKLCTYVLFMFFLCFQTCGTTGRTYSYSACRMMIKRFSKALVAVLKMKPGDTVGLILPNIPEYVVVIFGAMEAGLRVTCANPLYTPG